MFPSPQPPPTFFRREFTIAALLALLLGLLVVGRPVWDGEVVYLATDTATAQAPWHAAKEARNPELSDLGVAFYPMYRHVSERWGAGEVPLWTDDLNLGLPLLANPQWGVLDPQVLALVGLEQLGGVRLFDRGFAWLAVLRIAGAALGTWLLARRLGLGRSGAALSACGFALSGSLILWLGYSLGHVIPWLPWLLLSIEAQGGRRPALAFAGTSLTLALAIYGGHPETAFFVGLTGAIWAARIGGADPPAARLSFVALACGVLLAAPSLLPFLEYLESSGALLAHQLATERRGVPDLLSLGVLLLFAWLLSLWRGSRAAGGAPRTTAGELGHTLSILLAALGLVWVLTRRGLVLSTESPGGGFIERGSAWLPLPILALALVALFGGTSRLRRGGLVTLLGAIALLLALETPGVVDLWRWLPLVGHAAPGRAACVAALFLSLLAGAALECPGIRARGAAFGGVLLVGGIFVGASDPTPLPPHLARLDPPDEVLTYDRLPPPLAGGDDARLEGILRGGVALDSLVLVVERLDTRGEAAGPRYTRAASLDPGDADGARRFEFGPLDLDALGPGDWRFRLEFRREGVPFASRNAALTHVRGGGSPSWLFYAVAAAVLALLLVGWSGAGAAAFSVLAILQGLVLARGWNPAVPRGEHFPSSRAEELLAERFDGERILADTGILPGNTALVRGLSTVGGYDAMNVASFDGFRAHALKEGANPLLDWDASGIDPASPAFRLLGVRALLFQGPKRLDGWSTIGGPAGEGAESEVWILEADDPLPRAFCVSRIVSRLSALSDPAGFDPRESAFLDASRPLELDSPFETSRVQELSRSAGVLEYEVELDGEGLFVVTDQHFPGWRATVDGRDAEILRVDSVVRGVWLPAGGHSVRFEYAPRSWWWGRLLGWVGLGVLAAGTVLVWRWARPRR